MYDFLGTETSRAPRRRRLPVPAPFGASTSASTINAPPSSSAAPASRDETLAAARAERERRARFKAETNAAQRIQSFWRGRRCASSARSAVRAAWIERYGPRCERGIEGVATTSLSPQPPLVSGVAFFARPSEAADAEALAGACSALLLAAAPSSNPPPSSGPILSSLTPAAGAALSEKAAEALWDHRGGLGERELCSPRGCSAPSPSSSSARPFATPLADALISLADPTFWEKNCPGCSSAGAAAAAAGASLLAAVGARRRKRGGGGGGGGGRLLARAAALLPAETSIGTANSVPSLAASLISNLAARCVALGGAATAAAASTKDDENETQDALAALLCSRSLWLRAPPLAPLAPRLCRVAALRVTAAVASCEPGSAAAASALSSWLTPLLAEPQEEEDEETASPSSLWSVPGGLGAASAALAGNIAYAAGRAVSAPAPSSPSAAAGSDASASVAVALCRSLALLLRASPPEALGEKKASKKSGMELFCGGHGEESETSSSSDGDEDEATMRDVLPPPSCPSLPSPYLPLESSSFASSSSPPVGISSLTDAFGFLGPLVSAALPVAAAEEEATAATPAAVALCDLLLAVMALPSRRLQTLAALASSSSLGGGSGSSSFVSRLWFSSARGAWRAALVENTATTSSSSPPSASASAAAASSICRDRAALSVLAVLSSAAATAFSIAPPDAPAAGKVLPLEELSSVVVAPSSSSAVPGSGLLDLARDFSWHVLSGESSPSSSPSSCTGDNGAAARQQQRFPPAWQRRRENASSSSTETATPALAAALEGATSLLRILHDRNGTEPFAPEWAFHAAPLRDGGEGSEQQQQERGEGDATMNVDVENEDDDDGDEMEEVFEDEFGGIVVQRRAHRGGTLGVRGASNPTDSASSARFRATLAAGRAAASRLRSVLRRAPCLIPFRERASAFVEALARDAGEASGGADALALGGGGGGARQRNQSSAPRFAVVRRGRVFADALKTLGPLPASALKGRVRVAFVDEHGLEEAGVDGGGLFKEFCEALVKEAFWPRATENDDDGNEEATPSPSLPSLFVETAARELAPAPGVGCDRASAARLSFLGRFLGKLLQEGVLVELPLARFFVKQLLCGGKQPDLGDLSSLDPALAASLAALRRASASEIEASGLTFTVSVPTAAVGGGRGGKGKDFVDVDLVPGGCSLPVTSANVSEFVHRAAAAHLSLSNPAAAALRSGLESFLPRSWVFTKSKNGKGGSSLPFSAAEFSVLLGGGRHGVDVEDMRRHATYAGGYHDSHSTINALWEALRGMSDAERSSVLRFATGCGRPPLLGFSRLRPKLCVAKSGGGDDEGFYSSSPTTTSRLPSASTCMNLLKLPPYRTAEEVRKKLLYAASEGAGGFSLS